jgi:hypothetical protein
MKSGRLLKFHRPGGDVHVYLYHEGGEVRAALYVMGAGGDEGSPVHTVAGPSEERVEADARAWVEARFPKGPSGRRP